MQEPWRDARAKAFTLCSSEGKEKPIKEPLKAGPGNDDDSHGGEPWNYRKQRLSGSKTSWVE
jgi:hypothetical protein